MVRILISLFPVLVFLAALIYLDSFKLVKRSLVIQSILAGISVAGLSYLINIYLLTNLSIHTSTYSLYISPMIEETLKASFIIYLIAKQKVGFMVDAAIYGFAIGAGFALIENIYYLNAVDQSNLFVWFIRGFGTAVMHGGTTAVFAIITKSISDRRNEFKLSQLLPGFLFVVLYHLFPGLILAIGIHSFFNHFILAPVILTMLQLLILPLVIIFVFYRSERILKNWLESGLDTDVELLEQINDGKLSESHIGQYLATLQNSFSPEVIVDMIAYIRNHIELAIEAKGVLLLKQAGVPYQIDEDTRAKFTELKYLEKSIGQTGKLAISPILHTSTHDLWQLYMLEQS